MGLASWLLERELNRAAAEEGTPQVVHAHNVFPAGIASARFATRHGAPLVITEHSSAYRRSLLSPSEVARAASMLQQAAAVIAVSPAQAAVLPTARDRVRVIPNVVPVGQFRLRTEAAAQQGPILCIAALTPVKGLPVLLRAYANLPADLCVRHRLRIIGDGPQRAELVALTAQLGLRGQVDFTGYLAPERVREELAQAALVASASDTETFGLTLVEAMAAGVPFVATDSGGPRSIWSPGAGLLVPPGSPADLARGLETALADGSLQTPDQDRWRRHEAEQRFGPDAIATALRACYAEVTTAP